MSVKSETEKLLRNFRSQPTLRAGSLIITVFGDAIAPRGGTVWIGSLIAALVDFGVSERLVRTSVFRLTQDDWFVVDQVGRRSFYSLSADGMRRFEQATRRIYGQSSTSWSGDWCLVLLQDVDAAQKENLRRELDWLGFAAISTNVLAHPSPIVSELDDVLGRCGVLEDLVVMLGKTVDQKRDKAMRALVHRRWNLAEIDARYRSFSQQFRPLYLALQKRGTIDARHAFLVRILLVQEYRKILLRDPLLPAALLPQGWHGNAAHQLCRNLYAQVCNAADDYMSDEFETAVGPLPPPGPEFFARFGGLPKRREHG